MSPPHRDDGLYFMGTSVYSTLILTMLYKVYVVREGLEVQLEIFLEKHGTASLKKIVLVALLWICYFGYDHAPKPSQH